MLDPQLYNNVHVLTGFLQVSLGLSSHSTTSSQIHVGLMLQGNYKT